MRNYYQILGVDRKANGLEIKKSYRKLATKFHPDKNDGDTFFESRFKEIQEAYEVLSNSTKKVGYDEKLDDFLNRKPNSTTKKKEPSQNQEPKKKDYEKKNKPSIKTTIFIVLVIIISIIFYNKSFDNIFPQTTEQNDKDQSQKIQNNKVEFVTFNNTLRGYKIDYPKTWQPKGLPPTNGDGRTFNNNRNTELTVYSGINVFNTTLAEEFEKELKNNDYNITYKIIKDNWYVISGFTLNNDKEFYKKVYRSEKYDEQRTMFLSYDVENHNEMQKTIPVLIKTFKDI
ncbi:DnaJ domain-containing protein [Hwangdonia sp.]|uniref:DnaJ domain-containing protein n=1 Tax=Hwangdonia sp. TaxID=1883432 RepID=UPI003AB8380E